MQYVGTSDSRRSNNDRRSAMKWLMIPLVALLIISAGCLPKCPTMPLIPSKPALQVERMNGGICLDRSNTEKLMLYILDLEQGYN